MMTSFAWTTPPDVLIKGWQQYQANFESGLQMLLKSYSQRIEEWMRANAQWEDQTGAARAMLQVDLEVVQDSIILTLSHGKNPEGVFLELANMGKFAIITPAIDYWGPQIMQGVQGLLA